jgi:two-component system, NtrC family, nitrogen regulation response regulator NtrX
VARILVIDDSEVIRALLTDFLGDLGHEVVTAADGEEGLQKARTGGWDLCICDLHLPKRNGYEILTALGEQRGSIQFVFTDSLPDELRKQVAATTTFPCLRKPFDLDQLRDLLTRVLKPAHVE